MTVATDGLPGRPPGHRGRRLAAPLPVEVAPFRDEALSSFLSRVTRANHMKVGHLESYLTADPASAQTGLDVHRLAAAIARTPGALRAAMPELNSGIGAGTGLAGDVGGDRVFGRVRRRACTTCTTVRGARPPGSAVEVWSGPADTVCHRHQRWLGSHLPTLQIRITAAPEIAQACHRHQYLIGHYGAVRVAQAYADAERACRWMHTACREPPAWGDRAHRLARCPGWPYEGVELAPVVYPELIALAGVFLSPRLIALAASGVETDLEAFCQEVSVRTGNRYVCDTFRNHPIGRWINDRRQERGQRHEPGRGAR